MKILGYLFAVIAALASVNAAYAASPAFKAGNSCGSTASSSTLTCNIRLDGSGVASGDAVIVTSSWGSFGLALAANSSSTTLTFASVPATVVVGNKVVDLTTPSAIGQGVTVTGTSGTTVTLSSAASGALNGDNIYFDSGTVTDNQNNVYTVVDSKISPNLFTTKTFRALNVTNAPTSFTVSYAGAPTFRVGVSDEYSGVGSTVDAHAVNEQTSGSGTITSGSITTTTDGDLIYAVTMNAGSATPTAGTNFMLRESSKVSGNDWGFSEDWVQPTHGSTAGTFSSISADDYMTTVVALTPATPSPTPKSISCTPAVLADNAASGTVVCAFTVNMSDGTSYSGGTNTISPTGTFAESSSTGNGNVTLSRTLGGIGDDGMHSFTLSATKNGGTVTQTFWMTVTAATVAGNPYSLGWKNIDPGASMTDGSVFFTAPRAMTVNEISMRVVTPVTGPALVDVYKAGPGTPCQQGFKLHFGDLDATVSPDHVQTVLLNAANTSLNIYDSVCLVTSQPFPLSGQATVTVTAN